MPDPPSRTIIITFPFTGSRGSTTRWERHRDQIPRALAGHDEVLREASVSVPVRQDWGQYQARATISGDLADPTSCRRCARSSAPASRYGSFRVVLQ